MTATRKQKPRTLTYNARVDCLHIKQGNVEQGYWLDHLAHDFGPAVRCFRLSKIILPADLPGNYDVVVEGNGGRCECKGFLRHHHCKHVDALRVLLERGAL